MGDDLIRRSDAIKALSEVFANCEPCSKDEAVDIAMTTIRELPSVDEKIGVWIEEYREDVHPLFRHRWRCSECGACNSYGELDSCPYCRSRMRGAKDAKMQYLWGVLGEHEQR